ncbi:class I SAM-dependent methyltransferase [Couchioplanes caeruleus]|uniref:class I SAM-dependent methyltransferase n=1 Tax=Couchioplanes caeruleus TaxID=56438 RepID=UPI0020C10BD9|nr:class I SAM-dependent methyltransferase [Couchioplanes caeruleus]UQU66834.1 class I SAM-dependent methyltransferase [Couchioplanes caeruleus]
MSTPSAPFTDPALIRGPLYGSPERLGQRTNALHRAKIIGADATETIAALAMAAHPAPARVADIGCGRGTTTVRLARQYPTAAIVAVDQSPALLAVVGDRLRAHNRHAHLVQADFHRLPDDVHDLDLAVAAFCLYHSPHPEQALTEIADRLVPGGVLIVTTKSADSYREVDAAIAASGLDPQATSRASLYQSFHTGNAATVLAAAGLVTRRRLDQQHTFRFPDAGHLADYAATNPKYQLLPETTNEPAALAAALHACTPSTPVTTTSTVTYLVTARP